MYKLSKDYDALWTFVEAGQEPVCFVDYNWRDGGAPFRDIARIRRFHPYTIQIGARGIGYGSVDSWQKDKGSEKDLFINECNSLNLEWIYP